MTCQRALAEDLDDLAGVVRADALDQAGAEVLLDALPVCGGVVRRLVGLELHAVVAVLDPVALASTYSPARRPAGGRRR